MKKYYILIITLVSLISCKKDLVPQESTISFDEKQTTNSTPTLNNPTSNPGVQNGNVMQQKPNPPHGQPGHVCGTENQQANNQAIQTQPSNNQQFTVSQPISTNKVLTQNPTKVAKGMNPPHGQPGHRCDIAVGAPLNSKPKTVTPAPTSTTVTSTPTITNNVPSILSPNTPSIPSETVKTEPGMNPPHGQPGHRCDIAVGSPLNQEKKPEEKKEEAPK